MSKKTATRAVATLVLIVGLSVAPLLDQNDPDTSATAVATPTPELSIVWLRGELHIAGHTRSRQHEQDLLEVAAGAYPGTPVSTDFRPLGTVPDYWEDVTIQILYLLAEADSARANLSVEELNIRGVTTDELAWKIRLNALKKVMPEQIAVTANIMLVDEPANVAAICQRAFAAFEFGPINFAESSADFRDSAYPRLARIAALVNACRNSEISITGHTDASGSQAWNLRLSLIRAHAVADHLVNSGVDRERFRVLGMGSMLPVADNQTRYGRGRNRRIEIILGGQ